MNTDASRDPLTGLQSEACPIWHDGSYSGQSFFLFGQSSHFDQGNRHSICRAPSETSSGSEFEAITYADFGPERLQPREIADLARGLRLLVEVVGDS